MNWYKRFLKASSITQIEDIFELISNAQYEIMAEYYSKGRKKGSMMSWSVVPYARLKKIWKDFAELGFVRDEEGLNQIIDKVLSNLARLQAATELSGHSQLDSSEIIKELGFRVPGGKNADFYFYFLETPYGSPISDYGLPKLWALAEQLLTKTTAEEKLVVLDQFLNVIHPRGDLAALFIEGGKSSLADLSAAPKKDEKSNGEKLML